MYVLMSKLKNISRSLLCQFLCHVYLESVSIYAFGEKNILKIP